MKNLYFVSFYYDEKKQTSVNINKPKERLSVYLSNCCTALLSAKNHNPNVDVALITNLTFIEERYQNILNEAGIKILTCPFDSFLFPDSFKWSAAFYKLCALAFVLKTIGVNYDNIMYTDSDVFCQLPFSSIWNECAEDKILLYDLCESSSNSLYKRFCEEMKFVGLNSPIHYGGEFYASSVKNAKFFIERCLFFYDLLIRNKTTFASGDELIVSAAGNTISNTKNAGAFVFRFWTDSFRISTTRYLFNPVIVLHCPDQKERGLKKLFEYYLRHGRFPKTKKVHSVLNLSHVSLKTKIIRFLSIFLKKYKIRSYFE